MDNMISSSSEIFLENTKARLDVEDCVFHANIHTSLRKFPLGLYLLQVFYMDNQSFALSLFYNSLL